MSGTGSSAAAGGVRGLAQEAVAFYLSHLDDCTPHPENIKRYFRGPVLALTISILSSSSSSSSSESAENAATSTAAASTKANGGGGGAEPPLEEEAPAVVQDKATNKEGGETVTSTETQQQQPPEQDAHKTAALNSAGANWKDYLNAHANNNNKTGKNSSTTGSTAIPEFSEKEQDPAAYHDLSERAKARVEAFLLGVALALPAEDPHATTTTASGSASVASASSASQQQQQQHRPQPEKQMSARLSLKERRRQLAAVNSNYSSASSSARSFLSSNSSHHNNNNNGSGVTSADNKRHHLSSSGYASANSSNHSFALIEGLAGFRSLEHNKSNGPSSFIRSMSSSRSLTITKRPQMRQHDLVTRLELYLRTLLRVCSLQRECVIAAEPPRAVKARAVALVASFIDTVSTVRQQGPVLTRLLQTMTKEIMAVSQLSEELCRVIRRLVSDYEHTTSFASLAFLSSPENAADEKLTPAVLSYIRYLQANWRQAAADCDLERLLSRSLDAAMRHTFKTVEFRSIGHLLEVCHAYRSELQHIEFPPTANYPTGNGDVASDGDPTTTTNISDAAIQQALRDLQREVITVNGHVLPPVTNRSELIQLLQQTLNSRSLLATPPPSTSRGSRSSRRRRRKNNGRASRGVARNDSAASGASFASSSDIDQHQFNSSFLSSGSDGDYNVSSPLSAASDHTAASNSGAPPDRGIFRGRSFRLSTVDFLTKRLLIAGSRTGTGGDAYFVVRDLFGGDDVEVVPSNNTTVGAGLMQPRRETIEILVRLASVTIRCHGSFDVYPKSLVGSCEPLIQVHTTTSETISLQEIRATDAGDGAAGRPENYKGEDGALLHMVVHERKTEKTGWRTLSVRPALYERVEVWNTPS